jgi:hypothetical protein
MSNESVCEKTLRFNLLSNLTHDIERKVKKRKFKKLSEANKIATKQKVRKSYAEGKKQKQKQKQKQK